MVELSPGIVMSICSGLGGALAALLVAHFVAGRDVAFMKGQLQSLMSIHERVGKLEQKAAVYERAHTNLRDDVNKLGAKVRASVQPTTIKGA